MDFSRSSKSGDIDKQLELVKQQVQAHMLTKKLQQINDKCFEKCVTKPGSSLDKSQQKCLAHCMDRWEDTEKIVAQALMARVQEEGGM